MLRTRWVTRLVAGLLGAALSLTIPIASAQSAAQLDALKSMSPSDRAALMKQMGIDPESAGAATDGAQPKKIEPRLPRKSAARSATEDPEASEAELDPETGLPRPTKRFKPGDTVLLEVDLQRGKPAQVIPQPNGLPPINVPAVPEPELTGDERQYLEQFFDFVASTQSVPNRGGRNAATPGCSCSLDRRAH